jgi:glycosyltransferase involved in cell wall biosynthesis
VTEKPTHTCALAIIGGLPPPYGGVSVHLKRLLPHLDRAGVDYHVYDTGESGTVSERVSPAGRRGAAWFLWFLLCGREPVVYLHSSRWGIWAATWWLSRVRGKSVVIALHTDSLRRLWPVRGWLARRSVLAAFRAAKALVAVNSHIRDFLDDVAGLGSRTVVIPAFVEPVAEPSRPDAISPEVRSFCEAHDPVILANGAPIVYDDGRDLYGIDMTIEMVDRLRSTWPRIGLVWYVLKFPGWSESYAGRMLEEVRRRGLEPHWLFADPTGEMYPVFEKVDLFVRPTCSDGDAVSIREALHFHVPTVASDAAPRPPGTLVFRSRDPDDFTATVRETLGSLEAARDRLAGLPRMSCVEGEIDLLRRVIDGRRPTPDTPLIGGHGKSPTD